MLVRPDLERITERVSAASLTAASLGDLADENPFEQCPASHDTQYRHVINPEISCCK